MQTQNENNIIYTFYNYSTLRESDMVFKNEIVYIRISPQSYVYKWYRYMLANVTYTKILISEIDADIFRKTRIWRSPIDGIILILNENDNLEAVKTISK